jgi:hypothetical protein
MACLFDPVTEAGDIGTVEMLRTTPAHPGDSNKAW